MNFRKYALFTFKYIINPSLASEITIVSFSLAYRVART